MFFFKYVILSYVIFTQYICFVLLFNIISKHIDLKFILSITTSVGRVHLAQIPTPKLLNNFCIVFFNQISILLEELFANVPTWLHIYVLYVKNSADLLVVVFRDDTNIFKIIYYVYVTIKSYNSEISGSTYLFYEITNQICSSVWNYWLLWFN